MPGGDAATAADGEEGDDLLTAVGIEDGGTAGGARAAVIRRYRSVGLVRFGWSLVVVRGLRVV